MAEEVPTYGDFVGFHHLEFYCSNAKQAADWMCMRFGFQKTHYRGLETESRDVCSHVIEQGDLSPNGKRIRLVYTSALNPTPHPINDFLAMHGDAVKDVAFQVTNCELVYETAIKYHSCEPVLTPDGQPEGVITTDEGVKIARVRFYENTADTENFGNCDCVHSFVEKPDGYDGFLPGYQKVTSEDPILSLLPPTGLLEVDHVVTNRGRGGNYDRENEEEKNELSAMVKAAEWYEKALGFHQFWSVDDTVIHTQWSALNSIVMADKTEKVRLPINEPAPGLKKSQIQEYVEYHGGAGVQHIALRTENIFESIRALRARGVEFLDVPDGYYDYVPGRMEQHTSAEVRDEVLPLIDRLRPLKILVDFDQKGYLLQIFTKPVEDRPTLFYEIIQRRGNEGFGFGNFKSLFETIEKEQAKRGNMEN